MKFLLFVITYLTVSIGLAQTLLVSSGAVPVKGGYDYLVTNNEPVEISVRLTLELNNLFSNRDLDSIFIVPAFAQEFKILELCSVDQKSYSYKAQSKYAPGNQNKSKDPPDFTYHLPFARNASFRVSQGDNGKISHQGKFAIDFSMPEGTAIHAARGGTVLQVKQNETLGCATLKCLDFANFIRILHDDGTVADYTHLKLNGSVVEKGDEVAVDQHIGYSGNTGYSTGPHLHFSVSIPQFGQSSVTIPVNFTAGNNVAIPALQKNHYYQKR